MPASLEEMFQKQLNNPNDLLGQQFSYLRDMNHIPQMDWKYFGGAKEGEYDRWANQLKVSPDSAWLEKTFAHELQHAVDAAHGRQQSQIEQNWEKTPEQQRFVEAVKKLDEPTKIPLGDLNEYRARRGERQAYGVANSRYQAPSYLEYSGSSHLDPTMATEQAILMDLAKRSLKSKPAVKQEPKRDYIDETINNATDLIRNMFTRK